MKLKVYLPEDSIKIVYQSSLLQKKNIQESFMRIPVMDICLGEEVLDNQITH